MSLLGFQIEMFSFLEVGEVISEMATRSTQIEDLIQELNLQYVWKAQNVDFEIPSLITPITTSHTAYCRWRALVKVAKCGQYSGDLSHQIRLVPSPSSPSLG